MDIPPINKFRTYVNLATPRGLFSVAFFLLVFVRLIYMLLPAKIAWDASVYIGMGKHLATFGSVGLWEFFRPPVLPILFSFGEIIHFPIAWAQTLTFLASAGSLYLIYKIGERIRPFAGVFASIALGVSTLFLSFSTVSMTEVFGVFFSLLALYLLFLKEYYFAAGLTVALCFLTRFPYGLLAPIICLSFLYFNWQDKTLWKIFFKKSVYFSAGFLLISLLYLASNYFIYGDFFSPLLAGVEVISGSIWIYARHLGFYENVLFLKNPLFIFSLMTLYMTFFRGFFKEKKYMIFLLFIWFLIFFAYFFHEVHKEARYIITIFPAIALLAGISISYFYEKSKGYFFPALLSIFIVITFFSTTFFVLPRHISQSFRSFYSQLKKEQGKTVITSSPMVTAYSPVKIIPAYDRWEFFKNLYEQNRSKADFLLIDSCELHVCVPGDEVLCDSYKKAVLDEVYARENVIYDKTVGVCQHIIAEIKKD